MVNGSWLMAQGSRIRPQGPRLKAEKNLALGPLALVSQAKTDTSTDRKGSWKDVESQAKTDTSTDKSRGVECQSLKSN